MDCSASWSGVREEIRSVGPWGAVQLTGSVVATTIKEGFARSFTADSINVVKESWAVGQDLYQSSGAPPTEQDS